jgi:Uma2 family endonuclease
MVPWSDPELGEPAWEVALLFPRQGAWCECDYLALDTNLRVELCDGRLEVPPYLTDRHQSILGFLLIALHRFIAGKKLGKLLPGSFPVRLRPGTMRQPDLVFLSVDRFHLRSDRYWSGADLSVEVVSEEDPDRDWKTKRAEYAAAGIREYWIVDPRDRSITVLTLPEGETAYREAGRYTAGQEAASILLDGFRIGVADVFAAD